MSEKSELIAKLKTNKKTRESYVRAKINVNLPSQIRALRLRRGMKQEDLAREAEMMQPRISAMECPGATKFNLETLIRLAAALRVGLIVKFATFTEMLQWENKFSQDTFNVATIDEDIEFKDEQQSVASLPKSVLQPKSANVAPLFAGATLSGMDPVTRGSDFSRTLVKQGCLEWKTLPSPKQDLSPF